MVVERRKVPDGGGAAGALDYSLKRWDALGRFLEDGEVSIDENLIRPWAMGRKAWLFAGSELAGQRVRISANVTGDFGSVTALEPMLCCAGKIVGTMLC